ncbi:hypothetical protein [uncultured Anaerovibrio sp.]|uniref:ADP-ribosyltransferase-containing protein n=1 Tax=uncultured Anaerovibrio sp. TaxID=361586 RepID=UPI0025F9A9EA|nr:hypothetical protein [uncultured Anaerovibrio sp.]
MGMYIAGNEYDELRDRGVDVRTASEAAVFNAAVQTPLEYLGFSKMFKKLPVNSSLKGYTREFAERVLTEGTTEFLQEYPEQVSQIWALNHDKPAEDIAEMVQDELGNITRDAAYSGLIGGILGGTFGGAHMVLDSSLHHAVEKEIHNTKMNLVESQIANINQTETNPVLAAQVINSSTNDMVYVDGTALQEYAQTSGKMKELAQILGVEEEDIKRAASDGDYLDIRLGNFEAAAAKHNGFFQAVKDDTAFEDGGYTVNGEKLYKQEVEKSKQRAADLEVEQDGVLTSMLTAGVERKQANALVTMLTNYAMIMNPENPAQWMRDNALRFKQGGVAGAFNQAVNVKRNFGPKYKLVDIDGFSDLIGDTTMTEDAYKKAINFIQNKLALPNIKVTTSDLAAVFNFRGVGAGATAEHIVRARSGKSRSHKNTRVARNITISNPTEILKNAVLMEIQPTKHSDGPKKVNGKPGVNSYRFVIPVRFKQKPQVLVVTAEGFDENIFDKLNDVALYEVYEKKIPSSETLAGQSKDGISIDYSLPELLHNVKDLNGNPYVVDGKLQFEDEMVMDVTNNDYAQLGEAVENQKDDVRKQYEGTDQWMKAPNGEDTNLTEDQWLAVRTPAFKEWFGDWEKKPKQASKIVDENGEPMVVYHGTPLGGFTEFKRELNYFTADKEYADRYQDPGASSDYVKGVHEELGDAMTYPVFLNIRKPFDTRKAKERKIFENEFYRQWGNGVPLSEKGLPDWTDSDDFREFFEENEYDYDGLLLDEGGVPGEDGEVKSRGISYVAFESTQIKSATDNNGNFDGNDPNIYHQEGDIIKGAFNPEMQDGQYIISLFKGVDASTVIHETGHYFVETMWKAIESGQATKQVENDFDTLLEYAGMTRDQWAAADTQGRTTAHERLAEAFETYIMEGKAPSEQLKQAFKKFAEWLKAVYQTIRRSDNAIPLTDDVRQVFDRMLAAQDDIAEAERVNKYFANLPKVITDKMSDATKARVESFIENAREKAVDILTRKAMANFTKERREEIENYRAEILPEVSEEVKERRVYKNGYTRKDVKKYQELQDIVTGENEVGRQLTDEEEVFMMQFDLTAENFGYSSADGTYQVTGRKNCIKSNSRRASVKADLTAIFLRIFIVIEY